MKVKVSTAIILFILCFLLPACSKEQPAPQKALRVSATTAYQRYFGPAPASDKGDCFAFVIFFPSANSPGKVVPFPFFTFDQASLKKVAVQRLLAGMDLPAYKGEMAHPFASGAHLLSLSEQQGVVTVNFSGNFLTAPESGEGAVNALALTLSQFPGVKGVKLLSDGKALPFAAGIRQPDPAAALEPGPPRLLSITAMKEKGASAVSEVNAFFDRPVDIASLVLSDSKGVPFAGDTYHSVFDMAAVLKPKDPSLFTPDMPITVRYRLTDKAGRGAEGKVVRHLEVKEH